MPYIETVSYEASEGKLREIYDNLIGKRGKLAEVHKVQSLNPESITAHMDLYMRIMFGRSPLRRYQREMMTVVVSQANDCLYCIRHHAEALQFFWKDSDRVDRFSDSWRKVDDLSEKDRLLCQLAEKLTREPAFADKKTLLHQMREAGCNDRAILDAHLVIAYFNFVNRLVLGLGVDLESDGGTGYKYD